MEMWQHLENLYLQARALADRKKNSPLSKQSGRIGVRQGCQSR
jgi:hypothetical protein